MQYIFWLGSHPELSEKELLTTFKREKIKFSGVQSSYNFLLVELEAQLEEDFIKKLGGIDRIAKVLLTKESTITEPALIELLSSAETGKITVGISSHGCRAFSTKKSALSLKRKLKEIGIKMNFVLPQSGTSRLNSAQVIFNKLTEVPNSELNIVKFEENFFLARTCQVQDIQAYELRDTQRPARDSAVGMLPPKLAQVMLNLVPDFTLSQPSVYDPFCGMGTLLQEGWLKGLHMVGSDKEESMVEASAENLDWLDGHFDLDGSIEPRVFLHDISDTLPEKYNGSFDAVVTEPYLGSLLNNPLSKDEINYRQEELKPLYLKFFSNIRDVLVKDGWVVMVLPAFAKVASKGKKYVIFPSSLVDEIESLGYICNYFAGERRGLLYNRPNAYVARELTLWRREE